MPGRRRVVVIAGWCLVPLIVAAAYLLGNVDIAIHAVRLHLGAIGSSIYEYHSATGQWPGGAGDLTKTSLQTRSPRWRELLDSGAIEVVWNKTLEPNPDDNAHQVLAYQGRGLLTSFGRVWVCWGDLRTEYVEDDVLEAALQRAGE